MMKSINPTRIIIGIMIIAGLLFFKPLAYFTGIMMIFAGLTGICFLERFYAKVFGVSSSCSAMPAGSTSRPKKIGVIISSNDAETCWNAFRFANFCLNSSDEARSFLSAKGWNISRSVLRNLTLLSRPRNFWAPALRSLPAALA